MSSKQQRFFQKIAFALFGTILFVFPISSLQAAINYSEYFPNGSTTLQSQTNGWTTGPANVAKDIMTPEGCGRITSTSATLKFIPTKTLGEWNSFKNGVVPGVSFASCAVNCSYTTYQGSSCSASCGGGNRDTYYTKTVVESGGGTCPITEGQWAGWIGANCNTQACPVNCVGAWSDAATCSASCGGGVKQQVYTVSTAAANGGAACSATNGATRWGSTSCNTQACPINGSCGGSANTCASGSPGYYSDGGCGSSKSWGCYGSNGGTSIWCTIANPACPVGCPAQGPGDVPFTLPYPWTSHDGVFGGIGASPHGTSVWAYFGAQAHRDTSGPSLFKFFYTTSTCNNGTWSHVWN